MGQGPQGETMSPGWIVLAIFVAAVVVLIALTSRRQRLHGGSLPFDHTLRDLAKREGGAPWDAESRPPDDGTHGPTRT